jgi:hypothetical protein
MEADEAGRVLVRSMTEGVEALDALSKKAEQAAEKVATIKRQASGLNGVWDADGNLIEAQTERTNRGSGGGFAGYTERGAYERAKSEGLDDATALRLAKEFANTNRLGEFQAAIDAAVLAAARQASSSSSSNNGVAAAAQQSAPRESASPVVHRVDVHVGERSHSISTDAAGAEALNQLFRQLESDMSRS